MQHKIACIILLISFIGCSEEKEYPHKFPIILTEDVTDINSEGARFSARIQNLDDFKITSYGFVWGQSDNPTLTSSKLSLSSDFKEGRFTEVIQNDLEEGKTYFVRAFIQTDKVTVYGDTKVFTSKGSLAPVISGFSPAEGLFGTEIIVTGKNFSTKPTGNRVTIGGVEFAIVSANENELVIVQPETELCGSFPINIEVAGQIGTSSGKYQLIGPEIESISTTSGRVGDLLTLNGKYFDLADEGMFMYFGEPEWGNSSEVFKISATQIGCYVPNYAGHTGKLKLFSAIPDYKTFEYPQPFTILDSWEQRSQSTLPGVDMGYASAQINNVTYMIGGRSVYAYNLTTHTWTKKQDFPGEYRYFGTAFTFNDKLYFGFGAGYHEPNAGSNWQYYNDLWSYDPAMNTWTPLGSTPLSKRSRAVAVVINNKAYIGFGSMVDPSVISYGDLWEYNPVANAWSPINTSAIPNNFAPDPTAFVAGNKGYFVNVHYSDMPDTGVTWEFDPSSSQWTRKADLRDWVTGGPSTSMGEYGLVVCYANSHPRIYQYDPSNNEWITRQSLTQYFAPYLFASFYNKKLHLAGTEMWELTFD